ncbi:hypothetical protein BDV39DRAFT_200398 [Aspergillus sergii]|uniref:Uncharacterized protein n=1 Tax=Aspergillus sergii TaxID=1034303 RepID=A0A5N6XHE7_9EURO|nr:hypothetical protein BDV39DRAFT_200398 [Aspergillus sergii]
MNHIIFSFWAVLMLVDLRLLEICGIALSNRQSPPALTNYPQFMRRAEEAGDKPELLETGCITAGKRPSPTEAVAEDASESRRAKIIKQEPVEHADNDLSVKTGKELEYTLHGIPEKKVPFNPEEWADVILRGKYKAN